MASWNSVYQFDDMDSVMTRLRRLERGRQAERRGRLLTPSSDLVSMPSTLLTGDELDMASGGLLTRGAVPPAGVSGKFSYTSTDHSITIYWDGTNGSVLLSIIRANGSVVHVPGNSFTISGLTASTTYGFLPFWSVFNDCGIGWVVGDVGTPQFAFTAGAQTALAASQQFLIGREQLSTGFITFPTAAGGGTGSGGGGRPPGGTGNCIMLGTDIEPLGDYLYSTNHFPNSEWLRIQAHEYQRSLNCTLDHPLLSPDKGKLDAKEYKAGSWVITDAGEKKISEVTRFRRVCTKVAVSMPSGHLFFANGFLSHNFKAYQE